MALLAKNPPASAGDIRDTGSIPVFGKIPWRKAWRPILAFFPGESHGERSLVSYSPQSHKESDMTCRGPAPVDPGNLKQGRSWSLRKNYLITNIEIRKEWCSRKISGEKRVNNLVYAEK